MRLKLDENLSQEIKTIFLKNGFDASSVFDQEMTSSSDDNLIEVCRIEKRCLVSLDLDFSNPIRFKPSDYSGIAVYRLPHKQSLEDLVYLTHTFINTLKHKSIDGKLWIIQKDKIREYSEE